MSLICKVRKMWFLLFACLFIMTGVSELQFNITAYASDFGITDQFDNLEDDGKYAGSKYRHNYQLDVEKLGILEQGYEILNTLSNMVLWCIVFIARAATAVFYYALDFDIAALLSPAINNMQDSLRTNVFLPVFELALVGAFALAVMRFARRDFTGLLGQFGKVIFVFLLSILIVHDSATVMSYTSNITKDLAIAIMTGVSGADIGSETNDYASTAAGVLWVSLVHEPWKALEFENYNYSEDDVEFFLSETDSDAREEKIKEIRENYPNAFSKALVGKRIANGIIILLTMLVKCVIYILVAVMSMLFQLFTILLIILAPVLLIMSLIPGYDMAVIGTWCKKILETQIGILIITFLMGIMIMMDRMVHELGKTIGWYVALVLQNAIGIGLYYFRHEILKMLSMTTTTLGNTRQLKYKIRNLSTPSAMMDRSMRQGERMATRRAFKWKRNRSYDIRDVGGYRSYKSYNRQDRTKLERPSTTSLPPMRDPQYQTTPALTRSGEMTGTGIKGISYYAPREVTDNWQALWSAAEPRQPLKAGDEARIRKKYPAGRLTSYVPEADMKKIGTMERTRNQAHALAADKRRETEQTANSTIKSIPKGTLTEGSVLTAPADARKNRLAEPTGRSINGQAAELLSPAGTQTMEPPVGKELKRPIAYNPSVDGAYERPLMHSKETKVSRPLRTSAADSIRTETGTEQPERVRMAGNPASTTRKMERKEAPLIRKEAEGSRMAEKPSRPSIRGASLVSPVTQSDSVNFKDRDRGKLSKPSLTGKMGRGE